MTDLLAAVICWPFEVGTRFACRMRGHKLDSWSTIEFCRRPFCRYRRTTATDAEGGPRG